MTSDQQSRQLIRDGIKPEYRLPPLDEFSVTTTDHRPQVVHDWAEIYSIICDEV